MQILDGARSTPTVIRLQVSYRSARSLVTEYTACLARGGCLLTTRRAVEVGSVFRFEMVCEEHDEAVEIEGEVVRVRTIHGDSTSYELAVQYRSETAQVALEELLSRIGVDDTHQHQIVRRFPRYPVNLPAEDSQGLGRRYMIRDLSGGGMRLEVVGAPEVAVGSRVLLGVRFALRDPLVFVPGTLVWHRNTSDAQRFHLGVKFAELEALGEPQRLALRELTRLRRPSQIFLHMVEPLLRHTQRVTLATSHRHVSGAELSAMVVALARRELTVSLGMAVVESDLSSVLEAEHACEARVAFTGDLIGEVRLRASLELCAAVAAQLGGEMVPLDDKHMLQAAARELLVSLSGALCDQLEAAGHEVAMVSAPVGGGASSASAGEVSSAPSFAPSSASSSVSSSASSSVSSSASSSVSSSASSSAPGELVSSVSLAGLRGVAVLSVHAVRPRPLARVP